MHKAELVKRQKGIEARFNDLTEQKQNIVEELYRLQGEHRLLVELINNYPEEGKPNGPKSRRAEKLAN